MQGETITESNWNRFQGADRFANGDPPVYHYHELDLEHHAEVIAAGNGVYLEYHVFGGQYGNDGKHESYIAPYKPPTAEDALALLRVFGEPENIEELLALGFVRITGTDDGQSQAGEQNSGVNPPQQCALDSHPEIRDRVTECLRTIYEGNVMRLFDCAEELKEAGVTDASLAISDKCNRIMGILDEFDAAPLGWRKGEKRETPETTALREWHQPLMQYLHCLLEKLSELFNEQERQFEEAPTPYDFWRRQYALFLLFDMHRLAGLSPAAIKKSTWVDDTEPLIAAEMLLGDFHDPAHEYCYPQHNKRGFAATLGNLFDYRSSG